MKRVQISHSIDPDKQSLYTVDKKFSIYLGNGKTLHFTTRKDCTYAMAQINRRLNAITFQLNELYISAFAEYRRIWYYLTLLNNRPVEQFILDSNSDIRRFFALLLERSSWVNGNAFSFKHLFSIIESLKEQYGLFAGLRKKKKQFLEAHINENAIVTLDMIWEILETLTIEPKYSQRRH